MLFTLRVSQAVGFVAMQRETQVAFVTARVIAHQVRILGQINRFEQSASCLRRSLRSRSVWAAELTPPPPNLEPTRRDFVDPWWLCYCLAVTDAAARCPNILVWL
jgi:hypothetical protein